MPPRTHVSPENLGELYGQLKARELLDTAHRVEVVKRLDSISDEMKSLNTFLMGSATVPGVNLRLDRIEQVQDGRKKREIAAWTAVIGLMVKSAWDFFAGHK